MKFVYPIKGKTAEQLYKLNSEGKGGFYPLGDNNVYHGGMHFEGNHPLVAIADGQVIAYRYMNDHIEEEVDGKTYKYSNCFVLIRHHYKSPKEQELVFYSLYHHLRPWNECTENERGAIEVFGKQGFEITASSLNVREGMGTDKNVVGSLSSPNKQAATKIDDTWARLDDGPLKGNYFAHTYNGNSYAKPVVIPGEPELDDVITCTIDVKAGALIGYTGLYEAAGIARGYKTVHVEIFAGKDAESFISNPKKEGKLSHLIVSAGTVLKKRSFLQDPTPEFTRPAGCEVERIDENDDGDWAQVKDKKVLGNVAYAWLNDKYPPHGSLDHYTAKTANLADMQSAFPGVEIEAEAETTEETEATRFKWISHDGTGRRNIYTLPSSNNAAMYWVKKANLSGNKLTGNTPCYATPFELEDGDEVPDEHAVPIKETVKMYHEDGLWYRVKVPGARGWVEKDDVREATPFDWPGFRVLEEKETVFSFFFQPEDDHTVDYGNLPEFFQKLVDEIDANDDGKVSREEIKLALKQESIAHRLSRLICVHPSEWWADDEKTFWKPLLDMLGGKSDAMEQRLENLCWWEQVKGIDGFPDSPKVYHWNPVAFVESMKRLNNKIYEGQYLVNHVPAGSANRPGNPLSPEYLTIHSTGNPTSTANGERSWLTNPNNLNDDGEPSTTGFHIVVDENIAIECIPLSENAWHAADGYNGTGNRKSIGVEIIESGNREKTLENAARLAAQLLVDHEIPIENMRRHKDWYNPKDCPRILISPTSYNGQSHQTWAWFKSKVEGLM